MTVLALETTGVGGDLALLEDSVLIGQRRLPAGQRSAQSLVPAIHQLLSDHRWPINAIELIAVTQGPGSFTGLRVGITAAKALAYGLTVPVLGVDTLEILAEQAAVEVQHGSVRIHAGLDAQRNQLFAATFRSVPQSRGAKRQSPTQIIDLDEWLQNLRPGDLVVGPSVAKLQEQLPSSVIVASPSACEPAAATLGRLAWRDYSNGRRTDVWKLVPDYHRLSAAEEKAAAQDRATFQ